MKNQNSEMLNDYYTRFLSEILNNAHKHNEAQHNITVSLCLKFPCPVTIKLRICQTFTFITHIASCQYMPCLLRLQRCIHIVIL